MATRVAVGEVTCIEMERRLVELVEQVEREKEKTRDIFQQLHSLLVIREEGLLRELDGVVVKAKQELKEKKEVLQELRGVKTLFFPFHHSCFSSKAPTRQELLIPLPRHQHILL